MFSNPELESIKRMLHCTHEREKENSFDQNGVDEISRQARDDVGEMVRKEKGAFVPRENQVGAPNPEQDESCAPHYVEYKWIPFCLNKQNFAKKDIPKTINFITKPLARN